MYDKLQWSVHHDCKFWNLSKVFHDLNNNILNKSKIVSKFIQYKIITFYKTNIVLLLKFSHLFSQDLFTKFRVVSLKETILGGNQWLSENTKLTWTTADDSDHSRHDGERPSETPGQEFLDPKRVMLTPMQIRTFVAEISPNWTWFRYQNIYMYTHECSEF